MQRVSEWESVVFCGAAARRRRAAALCQGGGQRPKGAGRRCKGAPIPSSHQESLGLKMVL
jgi:hypothetical protein